ncbi:OmpA family protein [Halomonas elongata]|uniref:OmpA family protein n=2 Tax=Halomonas elongata TaxID=2746 RepID=E1VCP2_HALED|nr:OmpA family protein [Halomonas elongata]MBW5800808.1 OmpA family protein [Halomonas elongata]MDL4861138.1 OmpA family protein [Halomonas elongata]OBX36477.1 outer membrane porin F precursor [Halomonas elongata]RAW08862.1 OmpA family protein [Halomonas elongata]WBF19683.1 OmpA family protein [Halomonas elongata]
MKKSTTGLLLGSALVVGLSGCASSASQSSGMGDSSTSDRAWYKHPAVCSVAGGLIGAGIGYGVSDDDDEDTGAYVGGTVGATAAALLCAEPNKGPAPVGDSDGDGVPDDKDQCPGTPAGVAVDAVGCPLDSDGDGVPDYQDQCPGTPAGAEVNALGCVEDLVLQDVNFEFDSAQLTMGAESVLTDVASKLRANENVRVRIEGHTDSVGPAQYNKDLSQRRADSVASFLASQGIAANRMTTIGYGEEQPVASNDTKAGRAENRRVELGEWE